MGQWLLAKKTEAGLTVSYFLYPKRAKALAINSRSQSLYVVIPASTRSQMKDNAGQIQIFHQSRLLPFLVTFSLSHNDA